VILLMHVYISLCGRGDLFSRMHGEITKHLVGEKSVMYTGTLYEMNTGYCGRFP
jgi:hypothetical protein